LEGRIKVNDKQATMYEEKTQKTIQKNSYDKKRNLRIEASTRAPLSQVQPQKKKALIKASLPTTKTSIN
jgi:hypothetical protein